MAERLKNKRAVVWSLGWLLCDALKTRGGWWCVLADFGHEESKDVQLQKNKYVGCVIGDRRVRSTQRLPI